jgi:hypothetical protein
LLRVETIAIECSRELRLLGAATPVNAREERERLGRAFAAGREAVPRWMYFAHDVRTIQQRLGAIRTRAPELVRGRIDELLLECRIVRAIGTPAIGALAEARFGPRGDVAAEQVRKLAASWTRNPPARGRAETQTVTSDAPSEASLLSRMRAAVRAMSLPFDVIPSPTLSALAATGHRTILVATGREVTDAVARRTVLHEVSGHAAPRARAARMGDPLFTLGTAGGHDDQEGYALVLEERAGCLDSERAFELGARHIAAASMRNGASFVEVVRELRAIGTDATRAVLFAERAFRGSSGDAPGLGRETIYLEAFVRVKRRLAKHPRDEAILSSGQIGVAALDHIGLGKQPSRFINVPSSFAD